MIPQAVIAILRQYRFPLSSEKACQAAIAEGFDEQGIKYSREHQLSPSGIPDFLVGTTAVEVKLQGSKASIFRQCRRYCEYEGVDNLILVSNIAMGLPATVAGRGLWLHSLGTGWL
jgi:hypothetical protein